MNAFEKTIKDYLDKVAQSDAVFAQKYDEGKNIEGMQLGMELSKEVIEECSQQ
jgi:hypothetical protein